MQNGINSIETRSKLDKAALLKSIRDGLLEPNEAIELLRSVREEKPENKITDSKWEEQFLHDLTEQIGKLLRLEPGEIDLDMPVTQMGLDSLSATELNNKLRLRFGVTLQATAFFECNTVRDFYNYMVNVFFNKLRSHYQQRGEGRQQASLHEARVDSGHQTTNQDRIENGVDDPILSNLTRLWQEIEQRILNKDVIDEDSLFNCVQLHLRGQPSIEVCLAGQGTPLLLLGGLLNPATIWHKQVQALARHYRLIVFNMPGCGRSGVDPKTLSIASITENICYALDMLNINSAVPVVGFSFGGLLVQSLAIHYPQRVSSIVLINSTGRVKQRPEDVQNLKEEIAACPEVIAINGEIDFALAARYREVSANFDLTSDLGKIQMPALVISAEQDRYFGSQEGSRLNAGLPASSYVEIAQAGHFSILTHTEEINSHLLNFLGPSASIEAIANVGKS